MGLDVTFTPGRYRAIFNNRELVFSYFTFFVVPKFHEDEQDAYRIFRFNSSFFIGLSIFKLLNDVFGPKL